MTDKSAILQAKHLAKTYQDTAIAVPVFSDINLKITAGEMISIVGMSGAGKSTLLHLLGGLDQPTGGEVIIATENLTHASENQKDHLRNQYLGFIYQFHHLLQEFDVLDNVALRLVIRGKTPAEARHDAATMLQQVGLTHRLSHRVSQLSGGEKQRVAIARALLGQPICVLADEPTGNLDQKTAHSIFDLMCELNQSLCTSFIIVTHNQQLAAKTHKTYELKEGSLV